MITFLIGEDPYEDNLKRKSVFFAGLLKLNFGVPGRSTKNRKFIINCVAVAKQGDNRFGSVRLSDRPSVCLSVLSKIAF